MNGDFFAKKSWKFEDFNILYKNEEQSDFSRHLFSPIWVSECNEEISKAIAIIALYILGNEKFPNK